MGGHRARWYQVHEFGARVDVRRKVSMRGSRSAAHVGGDGIHTGKRATCVGVKTVAKTSVCRDGVPRESATPFELPERRVEARFDRTGLSGLKSNVEIVALQG